MRVRTTALLATSLTCFAAAWTMPSTGCSPSSPIRSVETAKELAEYTAALESCLDRGKDAGSRKVYRECADEVERRYSR